MTYTINICHTDPRGHLGPTITEQVNHDLIFECPVMADLVASRLNEQHATPHRRFVVSQFDNPISVAA